MVPHKVRMKACPPPPVHHPNTLENKHRCSFLIAAGFSSTTTLPPSKTSIHARFRECKPGLDPDRSWTRFSKVQGQGQWLVGPDLEGQIWVCQKCPGPGLDQPLASLQL